MSSPTTIPGPDPVSSQVPCAPAPERRRPRVFIAFLFWTFLIPVLLYLPVIPLVRTQIYMRWWPSHWGPMLDFAWNSSKQDADVVVFGDSSAFLGIDPRLINQQLGIKSIVLPNTVGSLPVTGDKPLDAYLSHNRKPRLIVLYFTAWDLNYADAKDSRLYEGEEMLLRHGTVAEIWHFALQHPLELPAFPLRNYTSFGVPILKKILTGHDRARETADALGHVDDQENYPPLQADCTLPPRYMKASSSDSVQNLASHYRALGYQVAVFLAPIPDCPNAAEISARSYDAVAAKPPQTLPASSFLQDGFYAHVQPRSVPLTSKFFADWLLKQFAHLDTSSCGASRSTAKLGARDLRARAHASGHFEPVP